ncbi:MAG: ATP-binding protein [Pseudomonadota bacterium]
MILSKIQSIKNRIIAIILFVCLITMGTAFVIITIMDISRIKKNMIDHASITADLVGQSCVSAIAFSYRGQAAENLKTLHFFPGIANAWVFDAGKELFASFVDGEKIDPAVFDMTNKPYQYQKGFLYLSKSIVYQDKTYGMIYLKIRPDIKKEINSRILLATILAFGLIFMAYLLARYSQRIISDPILMLSDTAKKISDAHNYSIRLKNTHEGEISILYDSFNRMLETIQIRQNERDAAERKYKGIFKNAVEGIFRITADGAILTANPSFATILGYQFSDEMISSEKQFLFPASEKDKKNLMQLLDTAGKVVDHRIQLFKKSGEKVWCSISASKIHSEEGAGFYYEGFVIDITERLEKENALREWKVARAANQTKSEFIANMSHEIRTPLNALLGFSELLSADIQDPKQKSYVEIMKTSGESLLTLIDDILDLSRIEAGKLIIKLKPVSLKQLFSEIEHIFKEKIINKKIDYQIDLDTDMPDYLLLDEIRLRQILLNLVGNSVKFTERGIIKLSAEKRKVQHSDTIDLIIQVTDTGIGINKKDQTAIFDPFKQVDGHIDRNHEGAGLGLAISKRLCEAMNGQISVASEQGVGTMFEVCLNNVKVSSKDIISDDNLSCKNDIDPTCFEKKKILIVDDIESNRFMLKELLIRFNQDVFEASDGKTALAMVKENLPDIILMDIRMPGMSGNQVTKILKSDPDTMHIPIIAFTGDIVAKNKDGFLKTGYDGYLSKPIKVQELTDELSKYINVTFRDRKITKQAQSLGSFTKADVLNPEKLILSLTNEILPQAKRHKNSIVISQMKNFSEQLRQLAQKHHVRPLADFSNELAEYTDLFDIIRIEEKIEELPGFTEELIRKL